MNKATQTRTTPEHDEVWDLLRVRRIEVVDEHDVVRISAETLPSGYAAVHVYHPQLGATGDAIAYATLEAGRDLEWGGAPRAGVGFHDDVDDAHVNLDAREVERLRGELEAQTRRLDRLETALAGAGHLLGWISAGGDATTEVEG